MAVFGMFGEELRCSAFMFEASGALQLARGDSSGTRRCVPQVRLRISTSLYGSLQTAPSWWRSAAYCSEVYRSLFQR